MHKLEEAYDATWRYGIPRALHQWNLTGWLQLFLLNFFRGHHFCVCLGIIFSGINQQESGVPCRCVLSVTMLTVVINGMASAVGSSVSTSLYVSDIAIYHSSQRVMTVEYHLQISVNHLSYWALWNGFTSFPQTSQQEHSVIYSSSSGFWVFILTETSHRYCTYDGCMLSANSHLTF
jgi:hypothetical protein